MSTFDNYKLLPSSQKKILFEFDISNPNEFWINYSPFTWYVNLDDNYPLISSFFPNHGDYNIENVGSMVESPQVLTEYTTIAGVQANAGAWYFDVATKNLYIHCTDNNKPAVHDIIIGAIIGFAKSSDYFNDIYYEPRLISVSNISISKDPLYFGRITFQSFNVILNNLDGAYDTLGEDYNIFGNRGRVKFGYADIPYSEYKTLREGFIENIDISTDQIKIDLQDERRSLSRSLPINIFDTTTYPDIKDKNANKPIPIAYGSIRNAEIICINEDASPTPTSYIFKICDTELHEIKSIDAVYVNAIAVTPASTDTTTATFTITSASGDYSPSDTVTCDFVGYVDTGGTEIENGLDIIKQLLIDYYNYVYNDIIFDTTEWNIATTLVSDIGIYINKETEIYTIIEDVANTIQTDIFYKTDGRLTAVKYDSTSSVVQQILKSELLTLPDIEYDATEVTTSTTILYHRDWKENEFLNLSDRSQEATLFAIHKTYINKSVETLLTNSTDAQNYSDTLLSISGTVKKILSFDVDISVLIDREITDFIYVPIVRQTQNMLGIAKCEILSISHNVMGNTTKVKCRIIQIYGYLIDHDGNYIITHDGEKILVED